MQPLPSEPLQLRDCSTFSDVPGVESGLWFNQQNVNLLRGDGQVFGTTGNDRELALIEVYFSVAQLDCKVPFDHQEQLVLVGMMMPDKFTFELRNLDV